jgi:hypothetical protein
LVSSHNGSQGAKYESIQDEAAGVAGDAGLFKWEELAKIIYIDLVNRVKESKQIKWGFI